MTEPQSKYWLDQIAEQIIQSNPNGEIVVESGHSPSGRYHIGSIREQLTASAVVWTLRQKGRKAKHLDFVDDFDVLRKIPAGLPESFSQHLGKPLYLVPDPVGDCHQNYADHFLSELDEDRHQAGCYPDEVVRDSQEYPKGTFDQVVVKALGKGDEIGQLISSVSGRELPADWSPVQLLSDNGRLDEWTFKSWDSSAKEIHYSQGDQTGAFKYEPGRVKLDWRVDWVGHWLIWNVAAEPFGRDHASKGGSYDTGVAVAKQVYNFEPPMPVPYEFVLIAGQTKKTSKSAGGALTPHQAMEVLPAEVLRYFMLKPLPKKQLSIDFGLGLYNLIDEFSGIQEALANGQPHPFEGAYRVAVAGKTEKVIASVRFSHLVSTFQASRGKFEEILASLKRSGWQPADTAEREVLEREVSFVKNWLEKYAPEEVKFSVQEKLPKVTLSDEQRAFLKLLATKVAEAELDGQGMHQAIYAAKDQTKLQPAEAFQAIYRVILGQDSGPKAGWFLASLDRDWLVKRLNFRA